MTDIRINIERLRSCIGRQVRHQGAFCEIIEVLEDGPHLVLRYVSETRVIQPNQYGDATRRVPQTYTLRVLSIEGDSLHPEFAGLDLPDPRDHP